MTTICTDGSSAQLYNEILLIKHVQSLSFSGSRRQLMHIFFFSWCTFFPAHYLLNISFCLHRSEVAEFIAPVFFPSRSSWLQNEHHNMNHFCFLYFTDEWLRLTFGTVALIALIFMSISLLYVFCMQVTERGLHPFLGKKKQKGVQMN